ncbi:MAG: EamA family transporter [Candidatus Latescibacteria bacterium]|nr:EamA family transporter [bacterium]MBD3424366.1 EamA family transporter [Candidatus Latescibacterota bacterium]
MEGWFREPPLSSETQIHRNQEVTGAPDRILTPCERSLMLKNLILIIMTVFLNTAGQFMMKTGINRIGMIGFDNFMESMVKAVTSGYVIGGFLSYAVSAVLWIVILSRSDLSWAFPMVSLSYVVTAIFAPYFLNEPFTITRFVGILVIVSGVFIVARTY